MLSKEVQKLRLMGFVTPFLFLLVLLRGLIMLKVLEQEFSLCFKAVGLLWAIPVRFWQNGTIKSLQNWLLAVHGGVLSHNWIALILKKVLEYIVFISPFQSVTNRFTET